AERLALELRDKLSDLTVEFAQITGPAGKVGLLDDALSALINLGYRRAEAEKALKSIWEKNGKEIPLETLIKESLNELS
ncbi:MAG: Holliday junction branch migration protein RuvA, partial [Nitrospinaceae bacterium]|nr:Holliday junction branch migration protein RuvA [Nitrospinaceae bacterium]